jgi:hypothetical protein
MPLTIMLREWRLPFEGGATGASGGALVEGSGAGAAAAGFGAGGGAWQLPRSQIESPAHSLSMVHSASA